MKLSFVAVIAVVGPAIAGPLEQPRLPGETDPSRQVEQETLYVSGRDAGLRERPREPTSVFLSHGEAVVVLGRRSDSLLVQVPSAKRIGWIDAEDVSRLKDAPYDRSTGQYNPALTAQGSMRSAGSRRRKSYLDYGQDVEAQLEHHRRYTSREGQDVHAPAKHVDGLSRPDGATALCGDGSYSFSHSRTGTCSRHGGISRWLR